MTSILLAGPATEPVTLAEAKAFLRVDGTDEDPFIQTLIAAARLHTESVSGRAMITQSWRVLVDQWPADRKLRLPVAPLKTLSEIRTYDADGEPTILALAEFQPESGTAPAHLVVPSMVADMPALRQYNGIEIDYVAGFGDAPENVPEDLRHAVLTLVGYWFEHRDAVIVAGSGAVVPAGFDRLIEGYRQVRL
ncbi:MAG: head-tail connector protein [Alphaproteobacteria bacterium]|nr:head-tail connector protein [Alphaproteobacteria bacterium]